MPLVRPEDWTPVGVDSLESAAEHVVRSDHNTLVVAGPGAGKTELLAQRACFLLETGLCPAPRRILAISFKRDAAKNLGERVQKRCGDRARRFDSLTLDAFAKGLVDRFMPALPAEWRPRVGYEVMVRSLPVDEMRGWLEAAGVPPDQEPLDIYGLQSEQIKKLFDLFSHGCQLPYDGADVHPVIRHLGRRRWREQLALPAARPSLTFPMLNRLAAFLLRNNPKLIAALRLTYVFVFLDEFQDTTASQYDLVRTAFRGSDSVLTAVGDSKQRIMVWAGAMTEVFDIYTSDFGATRYHLARNYRSAPELVRMQHVIAQAIEDATPPAEAAKADTEGNCVVLEFRSSEDEAEYLATLIDDGIKKDGKKPRDFCILVRQYTSDMIVQLKDALSARGIRLRDESQLQDLLAEPAAKFLLAILRLASRPRDAEAWDLLTSEIALLLGLSEVDDIVVIEQKAKRLLHHARNALNEDGQSDMKLLSELVAMVGEDSFRSAYRQYGSGSYLRDIVDGLSEAFEAALGVCGTPREAVDDLIGTDVVPAMTIHKSKGLEFSTVIFLGLEDRQWWAFANQSEEEKRGFFVAFSRAVEQVYFTFCDFRDERWGRRPQQKAEIGDLYAILQRAGVPTRDCRV